MKCISISKQYYEIIKKHKITRKANKLKFAAEDLIRKGKEFSDMCEMISAYADKKNAAPDKIVKEIFYSALEYKRFLDKNLPV